MTLPNLRPLGFGETLDRAFTLYRRNFVLFVGTAFLTLIGVIVMAGVLAGLAGVMAAMVPGPIAWIFMALIFLGIAAVAMIPTGAVTRQASQSYTGKPATLGDGVRAGGGAAMTLLGAGIIAVVSVVVLMLLLSIVAYLLNLVAGGVGSPSIALVMGTLTGVGMVVAFFLVASFYFGVIPAVVVEDKGPMEAVSRSLELAQGALPRIAGVMIVSILITYLPVIALAAVTGGFAATSLANTDMTAMVTSVVLQQMLTLLVNVITMPFLLSVIVVLYYDRRVRTEALDVRLVTEQLGLAGA
jgi:hypothetical protein